MVVDGPVDPNLPTQKLQVPVGTNRMNTLPQSAATQIRVKLFQDATTGEWAPAEVWKDTKNSLWYLEILRGSHSAVTFINAQGLDIRSNNPDNAVPNDAAVWVDQNPSSSSRTIFFYGRKISKGINHLPDEVSQFEIIQNGQPVRALLIVKVCEYPNNYVFIKLMGSSLCLNADDVRPYQLRVNEVIPTARRAPMSAQDIINLVLQQGNINHLIINSHGAMALIGEGSICLGQWFNRYNLDLWNQLRGKVRYIWLMNCDIGSDNLLCASIARNTQAWVSAPIMHTFNHPTIPPEHIEYFDRPAIKHWHGSDPRLQAGDNTPHGSEPFFYGARHSNSPGLNNSSLSFNIVKKGPINRP